MISILTPRKSDWKHFLDREGASERGGGAEKKGNIIENLFFVLEKNIMNPHGDSEVLL